MGRAVFCMVFDCDFSVSNDVAWGGPGIVGIREMLAIPWGHFFIFWGNSNFNKLPDSSITIHYLGNASHPSLCIAEGVISSSGNSLQVNEIAVQK